MSKNDELLTIDFWQDSTRIIQYCQSILTYAMPNRVIKVEVKFSGEDAFVTSTGSYGQNVISIPTIDPLVDITKQIYQRASFLRHELAHVLYTRELEKDKLPCSVALFNFLEDIRVERKFSNTFKGSYITFKTMRFLQFKKAAAHNISNFICEENFLAFMIYRSYGFKFPQNGIFIEFEKSFDKIRLMLNDLSIENYYEIMKILLEEYRLIFPVIKPAKEKRKQETISQEEIEEHQLDEDLIENLAPEILEDPKMPSFDIDDLIDEYKKEDNEESDQEEEEEPESEDDSVEIEIDTKPSGFSKESEIFDDDEEEEFVPSNKSERFSEESEPDDEDSDEYEDDYEHEEEIENPPQVEDTTKTFTFKKESNFEILHELKEKITQEIQNATFDLITTPRFIDLQELLDVAKIHGNTMPLEGQPQQLINTYNGIVRKNQKAILDLSIFLRQKTQNKIIHKIKPFQLDGEVDESNIADIFCSAEPRIFKNESYHYAPKNNIMVLLDCSGSMFNGTKMMDAIEVLIQLFEASRMAKFDVEVYGFSYTSATCEQKRKANLLNFCKKYGLYAYEYQKKTRTTIRVDMPGSIVFRIVDTKLLKGENDVFKKKAFLGSLYMASGFKSRDYAFNSIAGNTPEVQSMCMMQKFVRKTNAKNSLFMINDGMYSDSQYLNIRSNEILKKRGVYANLIYAPSVLDDFVYFQKEHKFNLYAFDMTAVRYFFPDLCREFVKEDSDVEFMKSELDRVMNLFLESMRDLFVKINNEINSLHKNFSPASLIQSIFDYQIIDDNKNDINNMILVEHNVKIDETEHKMYALLIVTGTNRRIVAIKTVALSAKEFLNDAMHFNMKDLDRFLRLVMDKFTNQVEKKTYRQMIKNIGCKVITIGIQSESGKEYNEDFVLVQKAEAAGTEISRRLKQIW